MRLSLDAFKAQTSEKEIQELENLSGGILGACHCVVCGADLGDPDDVGIMGGMAHMMGHQK